MNSHSTSNEELDFLVIRLLWNYLEILKKCFFRAIRTSIYVTGSQSRDILLSFSIAVGTIDTGIVLGHDCLCLL